MICQNTKYFASNAHGDLVNGKNEAKRKRDIERQSVFSFYFLRYLYKKKIKPK